MENESVRKLVADLSGHHICDHCADAFVAILDGIRNQRANAQSATGAATGAADPDDADDDLR